MDASEEQLKMFQTLDSGSFSSKHEWKCLGY